MILKPYYLACLSHASYLVGDERTRTALVVDPQRDVEQYLEDAERMGLEIRHVLLTHFHADFVSGHLELRERTGAEIHLGERAEAEYPFAPMREGESLEVGDVRLRFLATPGHTPESTSVVVFDLARDPERPVAVFTGDTLFIGDVGRPDLMASSGIGAEELAGALYDSLHEKLLALPDETLVYPAHGAGSMCGRSLSEERVSTIGEQRASNYALQPMPREEFVRLVTAEQPEAPAYFAWDAQLNRRERGTLSEAIRRELRPLALEEVLRRCNQGAVLLDVRDPDDYARGHLRGSANIGLGGRFASWAGTLLERDRPIVVVAEPGREGEALLRLGRIGFDSVEGYLEGGPAAFAGRPELVRRHPRLEADGAAARLFDDRAPTVVDVRTEREWREGRLEGSLNLPLNRLERELGRLPRERPLLLHCQSGYRSSIAASLLERHGFARLEDLRGGIQAWREAGLPTVAGAGEAAGAGEPAGERAGERR